MMINSKSIPIQPVILCGGSGTRLWPLSRQGFPKQFLVLSGTSSLFQQAIERISCFDGTLFLSLPALIVTNEEHRFLAQDQLTAVSNHTASILLEPVGRNTAPALTFAALQALSNNVDPVLIVTPADQTVQDAIAFTSAIEQSIQTAALGAIVVLGITADRPETGYGYIQQEGTAGLHGEYDVKAFVEKPNLQTAINYLASGDYAWNGGIFVLKASVWLQAIEQFRPDIFNATKAAWIKRTQDHCFVRPDSQLFAAIPSESIDYAVMEKCPGSQTSIKMVPLDAGWNDLGAWEAVWQVSETDPMGNAVQGDALLADTRNTFIHASHRLVSTVGVDNLVIIETADAVLVADKSQSQHVKKIITQLESQNREEQLLHRKVHRPWGWYDTIDSGDRFKVKRIQVKPGASLSLQMHHHRSEHWVVVKGAATVVNGDQVMTLTENQSTYIPQGHRHRLSNPGLEPLEIIEVQSGSYLGEDDIVRFDDTYGRN